MARHARRALTPAEKTYYDGAILLIARVNRANNKWSPYLNGIQSLFNQGQLVVDDVYCSDQGANAVADHVYETLKPTRYIYLLSTTMLPTSLGGPTGVATGTDFYRLCVWLAATLCHEWHHYRQGWSEPPAWTCELQFYRELYDLEIADHRKAPGSLEWHMRAYTVLQLGRDREVEANRFGYVKYRYWQPKIDAAVPNAFSGRNPREKAHMTVIVESSCSCRIVLFGRPVPTLQEINAVKLAGLNALVRSIVGSMSGTQRGVVPGPAGRNP